MRKQESIPYFCDMEPSFLLKQFIREHAEDDVNRLLLGASRYPGIDIPFAVEQIVSRRQIKEKLPSWYANDALLFPAKIAAEQCSSELTATYKQRLVGKDTHLCDLTGGLGIDSYFFSRKVKQVTYIERFSGYCQAARHNFGVLHANNIRVIEGDAVRLFPDISGIDTFYIDPARRAEGDKRVYALPDCEPDLTVILPALLRHAPKVIAKLSPMADIRQTLSLLPGTSEVHVLSVKNECKELLFVVQREGIDEPVIHCCNYTSEKEEEFFTFSFSDEKEAHPPLADKIGAYLYEPDSSILKAGAFKCIGSRFGVGKLHTSSHLYTSDNLIEDFPGRRFIVEEVLPFNNKLIKTLNKTIPQANLSIRNFPLSVEELRKRTKIADGGNTYLFATTLGNNNKILIRCKKALVG